ARHTAATTSRRWSRTPPSIEQKMPISGGAALDQAHSCAKPLPLDDSQHGLRILVRHPVQEGVLRCPLQITHLEELLRPPHEISRGKGSRYPSRNERLANATNDTHHGGCDGLLEPNMCEPSHQHRGLFRVA